MILGAIQSNRYLSEEEKNYLLTHLRLLDPNFDYAEDTSRMNFHPERPIARKNTTLPIDTSMLLTHIQTIHDAIQNNYQLKIIYGTYDIKEYTNKVHFRPRNPNKPYILNPYAMLWNDGEYYLIATYQNSEAPMHLRIDRIISVVPHVETDSKGYQQYVPCETLPTLLKPFFHPKKGHAPVFDAIKYANTYPGMHIFNSPHLINCCIECTPASLQILIDYFGSDLRLKDSPIEHSPDEVDYRGRPQRFLCATITNVQFENVLRFCVQQAQYLTVLSPPELVNDVKNTLKSITERYQNL